MGDEPDWKALAARGAAKKAADRDQEDARLESAFADVERRLLRRARLSTSPLYAWFEASIAAAMALTTAAILANAIDLNLMGLGVRRTVVMFGVLALLVPAVVMITARLQGGPRFAAEQRWLESLAFPVERHLLTLGYFDTSRGYASGVWGWVRLDVSFADPSALDEIADAIVGFDPLIEVTRENTTLRLQRERILSRTGSQHRYYRWFHRIVDGLLIPLSKRAKITGVLIYAQHIGRTRSNRGLFDEY